MEQEQQFEKIIEQERVKADKAKDELLNNIASMLTTFTNSQEQNLRESVGMARSSLNQSSEKIQLFSENCGISVANALSANTSYLADMTTKHEALTRDLAYFIARQSGLRPINIGFNG
jgi:hypothetical protein